MGAALPKQFLSWRGEPLLKATINAFFCPRMPKIDGIAIALPKDWLDEVASWAFPVPHWCIEGGKTRQESVAAAICLLPDEPQAIVLIHDSARPCPPAGPIAEAIEALGEWDGSVLAEASTDTLKRVDSSLKVLGTEPRELIYRAQTPQAATLQTWKKAISWARENGFVGTDDVSILEAMGLRVLAVPSPASNQKITLPEDWERLLHGPHATIDIAHGGNPRATQTLED
jgi:2-C-methyl-D-erythritol 4-phosphate cytidylyltransferase